MTDKTEIRSFDEVRAVDNDEGKMIVEGVVNNIGEYSKVIYGSFRERISEGVFERALKRAKESKRDVFFLALHNARSLPLASINSKTMELNEKDKKLYIRAELPDTTQNRDIYTLVKAGVLREFSFGFGNVKCEWGKDENGIRTRTINELDLGEVSLVCTGAYNNTSAEARGYNPYEEVKRQEESTNEESRALQEKEYQYRKNILKIRGVK
ncbi:MAG: HK97 family phage prohead protease [Vagococcus sp.]